MRSICDRMSLFNLREKVIADSLRDPETRKALADFAGTDEGKNLVRDFMNTPDGRQFLHQLVPILLEFLDIPAEAKEIVLRTVVREH